MQRQTIVGREMNPRRFRILAYMVLPLTFWAGHVGLDRAVASGDGPRPNFVVFIADDQGEGDLGCYGHPALKTPNVDRLAAEGMRFDRAFLTISSCSPTRASFLTGRYPHNTGAEDLHDPLPADQKTLAWYLGRAGYHTMSVGKWHLGDAEKGNWGRVVECAGRDTAQEAIKLLDERPENEPFFFWVATKDPHRPFDADAIPRPHDPADVVVPPYLPDHPLIRQEIAQYYDEIRRFDDHVGLVRAKLEEEGVLDATFIVYVSDNGMPFPRAKTTLYDSGIHTPLVVRYPPLVKPGTVQAGLVSTIDVAPTILELAGVEQTTTEGRSLLTMLEDPGAPGREAVYAEANWHDFEKFTRAVRTERYLLVRNYYWDKPLWNSVDSINAVTWKGFMEAHRAGKLTPAQGFLFVEPRPFEELYDVEKDPHALKNVVDDPRRRPDLNELRTLLDNWRVETGDHMPAERRLDGWTRDGRPLPHNQPWYDRYIKAGGKSSFEKF
ncbi:MAG: sulfatase family protein [Planctomycetota bacterium]|jgi:arylsulfatase A-like enzyme